MKKSLPALAIFLTFALVCSYIESLIPIPFGVPGMKLGLTNVVIILLLYLFGPFEALAVSMLRVLLIGFMFGNIYSLCYSLAGGLLSFICMFLLYKFSKFNMIAISVVGGFMHNLGQLLVAILFFDSAYLLYYLPVLLITGVVTGAVIGVIAQAIYSRVGKFLRGLGSKKIDVFMPGRFCIMGEHSDWASGYRTANPNIEKGYAIVIGMKEGVHLICEKADTFTYTYNDKKIELTKKDLQSDINHDFFEYVISSVKTIYGKYNVFGINIKCSKMTIPIAKGLSSSAAICMAVIRAFNRVYNLNISVDEEMALAYEAEINVGSQCGRLDQICAYGTGIRAVEFDGDKLDIQNIRWKGKYAFIIVDLAGFKDTKKILADLNNAYPNASNESEQELHDFLGKENKDYVLNVIMALEDEDYEKLGGLMVSYQHDFDNKVAPFSEELKAPLLHKFFEDIKGVEGVLGYKGVGSQGDGMAQVLVEYDKRDSVKTYIESQLELECIMLEIYK